MKVVFLGTNGWYSTCVGNTICTLVDSENCYIVLDAGDGLHKLDRYVKSEKPIYLFLSHLHFDHIIGLHTLGKFRFKQKICIYGYGGTIDGLKIVRHPYTAPFVDLPLQVEVKDLTGGRHNFPFPFVTAPLVHADHCLGYRFEIDNRIVTYCTDTGVCDSVYRLAKNADLLITECSFKPGQSDWSWPHLKPEDAATIAAETNTKQLILTHFDAHAYGTIKDREEALAKAKTIFKNTIAAYDNLELELGSE